MFFYPDGYVECVFSGIVNSTELREIVAELSRLIEEHGPTNFLLDGRNGRLHHGAGTLITVSDMPPMPKLKNAFILTSKEAGGQYADICTTS